MKDGNRKRRNRKSPRNSESADLYQDISIKNKKALLLPRKCKGIGKVGELASKGKISGGYFYKHKKGCLVRQLKILVKVFKHLDLFQNYTAVR